MKITKRKVKALVTLGPSSSDEQTLSSLIKEGVNGFRLNFSHGNTDEKEGIIRLLRGIGKDKPIIGDLQGPTVRLGKFTPLTLKTGQRFTVSLEGIVPIPSKEFFNLIDKGDRVLFEAGRITTKVLKVNGREALLETLVGGVLRPGKTVAVEGKEYPFPALTEKDLRDLEFCVKKGIDAIALSFVKRKEDVRDLRRRLEELGSDAWIIAKIETKSGVHNIDGIVEEADAILVARGDLGAHFPLEKIPMVQRRLVRRAMESGKPSIIATQLLDSMMSNPIPTRAEVMDVYSATIMGADALLLTGETAIGNYPIEALRWLIKVAREAEKEGIEYKRSGSEGLFDRFAKGVALMADSLGGKIVAYTRTGKTASRLSAYRPSKGIIAVTPYLKVTRRISLLWGVFGVTYRGEEVEDIIRYLQDRGYLKDELVVFTKGLRKGATDSVKVIRL
jgi:pyruvate kinase